MTDLQGGCPAWCAKLPAAYAEILQKLKNVKDFHFCHFFAELNSIFAAWQKTTSRDTYGS